MPYAILRFSKKKAGGVGSCYAHNERKKEQYASNPDIDTTRKQDNYHIVLPKQTYLREAKRLIKEAGCRTRKDSTVLVETLITASPEFIHSLPSPEQREYFQRAFEFLASKVGKENIVAATVHMDETTPHMHLVFCPITDGKNGKSLSAKTILGNRAQLSKWQTDYHAAMSARWPELQRGVSSLETKRKHIPVWLFKQAERLDKQFAEIAGVLEGINLFNAPKKKEAALAAFERLMPEAARFTVSVKQYDGYIKELEAAEKATQERIKQAESKGNERVHKVEATMQKAVDGKDRELAAKEQQILEARREAYAAADKLRRQAYQFEGFIGRMPLAMREKFYEIQKQAENAKSQKERRNER